jgi:hypothetical protein
MWGRKRRGANGRTSRLPEGWKRRSIHLTTDMADGVPGDEIVRLEALATKHSVNAEVVGLEPGKIRYEVTGFYFQVDNLVTEFLRGVPA